MFNLFYTFFLPCHRKVKLSHLLKSPYGENQVFNVVFMSV